MLTQEWSIFLKASSDIAQLWHQCLSHVSYKCIEETSQYIDSLKDIVKLVQISKHIKIKKSPTAQKSNSLESEYQVAKQTEALELWVCEPCVESKQTRVV